MPEPLDVLWSLAPAETRLELSLNLIVEILKVAEAQRIRVTLDDGKYEITLSRLEDTQSK